MASRWSVFTALRPSFVAYLERKTATAKTVSSLATRLAHFGRFLAACDPELASVAGLDRRRHIEPYLAALVNAVNTKTGGTITVADRAQRVLAVANFLAEITEWGWPEAPPRRLLFRPDVPRLPQPLPRYLPVDDDRRLGEELARSAYRRQPTPCCCSAPAGCASVSCSTSSWTACTRSTDKAGG